MKSKIFGVVMIFVLFAACITQSKKTTESKPAEPNYQENWESLAKHNEQPNWFQDAKLGIYFHWGIYSVPAFGDEWYPRWMHFEGHRMNRYHTTKYGHPSEFGYDKFAEMFKAEHFNADEWADLFVKAGARFAGPVAEHHDGYSMWDSEITPWNTMDTGPGKDIAGELEGAIKGKGMRFITTFHHAKQLQRYKGKEEEELEKHKERIGRAFGGSHYPLLEGMPPTLDDDKLNYLYGNIPEDQWLEEVWFG